MRVLSLQLTNVRQFSHERFDFGPGFNLLVGENGVGKSTVLRSLLTALGHAGNFRPADRLADDDIRYRTRELRVKVEWQRGNSVNAVEIHRRWRGATTQKGRPAKIPILWFGSNEAAARTLLGYKTRRYRIGKGGEQWDRDDLASREEYLFREEFMEPPDDEKQFEFGRSEIVRRFVGRVLSTFSPKFGRFVWRFLPYDCVVHLPATLSSDAKKALAFRREVRAEIMRFLDYDYPESRYRGWGHQRSATYKANGQPADGKKRLRSMPEFGDILRKAADRLRMSEALADVTLQIKLAPRIAILSPSGPLLLSQLSDGEKRIFSIIVDIARQLSLVRGGWREIERSTGLVVVDEIDCHLHPRWQRMIVPALEDLFPACQFIATTHSPFVIQAVQRGKLIRLEETGVGKVGESGNSLEDIVEDVQGIAMPQRSKRAEDLSRAAERYFRVLRLGRRASDQDLRDAESAYREASEPFTLEPGLNALLKLEAIAARAP